MDVGPHLEHLDEMWKRTTTRYLPYPVRWYEGESILEIRETVLKDKRVESWESVFFFKVLGTEISLGLYRHWFLPLSEARHKHQICSAKSTTYVTSQRRRQLERDRRWQKPSLEKNPEQELLGWVASLMNEGDPMAQAMVTV